MLWSVNNSRKRGGGFLPVGRHYSSVRIQSSPLIGSVLYFYIEGCAKYWVEHWGCDPGAGHCMFKNWRLHFPTKHTVCTLYISVICAVTQGILLHQRWCYHVQFPGFAQGVKHAFPRLCHAYLCICSCLFVFAYLYLCICVLAESMTGVLLVRWPNKPFRASAKHRAITLHLRSPRLRWPTKFTKYTKNKKK